MNYNFKDICNQIGYDIYITIKNEVYSSLYKKPLLKELKNNEIRIDGKLSYDKRKLKKGDKIKIITKDNIPVYLKIIEINYYKKHPTLSDVKHMMENIFWGKLKFDGTKPSKSGYGSTIWERLFQG